MGVNRSSRRLLKITNNKRRIQNVASMNGQNKSINFIGNHAMMRRGLDVQHSGTHNPFHLFLNEGNEKWRDNQFIFEKKGKILLVFNV